MKYTLPWIAFGTAALTLAAVTLLPVPASAKIKNAHKMHTKKHARMHAKASALTPAPGTTGPARTGTGPSAATGHVTGRVPSAVGDVGDQSNPPGAGSSNSERGR